MKKNLYLWCAFTLLAFVGCSSDKDDMEDDSLNEEVFLSQANIKPEFSKGYRSSRGQDTSYTDENNAEITRDCNGVVKFVYFNNTPTNSRPPSPEQFVSTYLGVDLNANFKKYQEEVNEYGYILSLYRQYYKDVEVENHGYVFHYSKKDNRISSVNGSFVEVENHGYVFHYSKKDNRISSVNGSFLPVSNLDVVPAFSETTARKIFAKYLNLSLDYIGDDVSLYIVEFPLSAESEQWAPRLVYKLGTDYDSDEGLCYIDAKTGRILYVWPNYIT